MGVYRGGADYAPRGGVSQEDARAEETRGAVTGVAAKRCIHRVLANLGLSERPSE